MILPISPSLLHLRLIFHFCFPLYKGSCLTSGSLSKQRSTYNEAKTRAWVIPETLAEIITVGVHMMYRRRSMASSVSYLVLSLAIISPWLSKYVLNISDLVRRQLLPKVLHTKRTSESECYPNDIETLLEVNLVESYVNTVWTECPKLFFFQLYCLVLPI